MDTDIIDNNSNDEDTITPSILEASILDITTLG
jgi:hypothetical protein